MKEENKQQQVKENEVYVTAELDYRGIHSEHRYSIFWKENIVITEATRADLIQLKSSIEDALAGTQEGGPK